MKNNTKVKKTTTKKCPRCHTTCLLNQTRCPECGLIFARLQNLSNKDAKKALKRGEKERVVYVTEPPKDVSKTKALLLCGFLGITGAHNYYLGRYKKAIYTTVVLLITMLLLILNESVFYGSWWYNLMYICYTPFGASILIMWFVDFGSIFMEKYKIPGAIPYPSYEEMRSSLNLEQVDTDLAKIREEKLKKNAAKNKAKKNKVVQMPQKPVEDVKEDVKNSVLGTTTFDNKVDSEKKEDVSSNEKKDSLVSNNEKVEEKLNKDERKIVTIKNKKYGSYNNTKKKKSKK